MKKQTPTRKKRIPPPPLNLSSPTTSSSRAGTSTTDDPDSEYDLDSDTEDCYVNTASSTISSATSRNNSLCSNLGLLASRRGSLSPKRLNEVKKMQSQAKAVQQQEQRRSSNFLELPSAHFGKRHSTKRHSLPALCITKSLAPHLRKTATIAANTQGGNDTDYEEDLFTTDNEEDSNPEEDPEEELYRLRTFNIRKNRVINCGDEFVRRSDNKSPLSSKPRSGNNSSYNSSRNSSTCCTSSYNSSYGNSNESIYDSILDEDELDTSCSSGEHYRVLMLGSSGVGKSSLVYQFQTSEYTNTYDLSLDDEYGERTVSLLLDDDPSPSEITFIDHPASEMSTENAIATYSNANAYLVTYSITDRDSYSNAEATLKYLYHQEDVKKKRVVVILVGNKSDLERAREISTSSAKSLASKQKIKFIETSVGIQHNVDELLVGVLRQCRLADNNKKKQKNGDEVNNTKKKKKKKRGFFNFQELIRKLLLSGGYGYYYGEMRKKSRSCQNLLF